MVGDMVEHVIVKADAGMDIGLTDAVKVQQDCNIRFFCDTMNLTRSTTHVLLLYTRLRRVHIYTSRLCIALKTRSVSSGRPTLIRMQSRSPARSK